MIAALLAALLGGIAAVPGYAPFEYFLLTILSLALLFALWRTPRRTPARGAALGFAWGLGCFLAGTSWVYVSLHDVGGMVMPLAAVATVLFCALLAVFPALAGLAFAAWRTPQSHAGHDALLVAGLWTLCEWLRGWVLTGFPWLAIGYSQTPPSPLAGFAPVLGVYGVGFVAALLAALPVFAGRRVATWLLVAALLAAGAGLRAVSWTESTGEPLKVSLLQGNIPQSLKWAPEMLDLSLETYERLATEHPADLTVLPETAMPLLYDQIPRDLLTRLTAHGDVLLGSALRLDEHGYANGAVAVARDLSAQKYAKVHLVPFGEYIPPGFDWFFRLVDIPMSNFTAGLPDQAPLHIAGQALMPNICYEDLFGEELRRALPAATLLVNLSNTAWFGHSLAQPQHLQIARLRALETGRPIVRATNTGMTAAIAPDGTVTAVLPPFTRDALTTTVQGHTGLTPYARFGNLPAVLLALLACLPACLTAWFARRRSA